MFKVLKKLYTKSRLTVVATVVGLAVATAGTVTIAQPSSITPDAAASTCDAVNIVHCGLNGSSASDYIKSYQHFYRTSSDGRYNDIRAVYRWSGATDAAVNGMSTANSKLGTLYRNGDIKVGGKVVGHDSWVSARFGAGRPGFVHVEGNVYARKTTTSLEHDTYKVLVHFNSYGEATYAVMVGCGNAVKFTKVPNKPVLNCESLSFQAVRGEDRTYTFTAKANAKNTQITSYTFHFGDGKVATQKTSRTSTSIRHTYAQAGKSYSAYVVVDSTRTGGDTSPNCHVTVRTPAAPSLACTGLSARIVADKANTYRFTATASASHTKITNYVFNFGDGKKQTVTTSNSRATATHTYAKADTTYNARVTVNSQDIKNKTSNKCVFTIKTPKVPEAPQLLCENLTFDVVADQDNTYRFTAQASAANTTIENYVFDFGDGNHQTVTTNATMARTTHTYANDDQEFTAKVTVNSKDLRGVSSPSCQVTISKQTPECKPGVPVGSPECEEECKPGVPMGSPECKPQVLGTATELPNTGPGDVIGFFGATTIAGSLIHRFILRRKQTA